MNNKRWLTIFYTILLGVIISSCGGNSKITVISATLTGVEVSLQRNLDVGTLLNEELFIKNAPEGLTNVVITLTGVGHEDFNVMVSAGATAGAYNGRISLVNSLENKGGSTYNLIATVTINGKTLTVPVVIHVIAGLHYFTWMDSHSTSCQVWRSNGTVAGTQMIKSVNNSLGCPNTNQFSSHAVLGNNHFFTANNSNTGFELWKTDGSADGTIKIKDIGVNNTAAFYYGLPNLEMMNGHIYFLATAAMNTSPSHNATLYKSGGTAATTVIVEEDLGWAAYLSTVGNKLVFTIDNPAGLGAPNWEPWVSDGVNEASLLRDIKPGDNGSQFLSSGVISFKGKLYSRAKSGAAYQNIWMTDGTTAGTALLKDVGSGPSNLTISGDVFYFNTSTGLYKSDGTNAGTLLVKKDFSLAAGEKFRELGSVDDRLFFSFDDGVKGFELWTSDGTSSGTKLVKDIVLGGDGSYPEAFASLNGKLYFWVNGGALWESDGSEAGTKQVAHFNGYQVSSYFNGKAITASEGILYLELISDSGVYELWRSDGTANGTFKLSTGSHVGG